MHLSYVALCVLTFAVQCDASRKRFPTTKATRLYNGLNSSKRMNVPFPAHVLESKKELLAAIRHFQRLNFTIESTLRLHATDQDEAERTIQATLELILQSWIEEEDPLNLVQKALSENNLVVLFCAQKSGLLKWRHPRDYHWFYVHSYGKPWFSNGLWSGVWFDWDKYSLLILNEDNAGLFGHFVDNTIVSPVAIEIMKNKSNLVSCGAVAILKSLEMNIDSASIQMLIDGGNANALRKLYENGVNVFAEKSLFAVITSPDVLQFVLFVRSDLVDGQKTTSSALALDQPDILQVFYQHHGKLFLSQDVVNAAARTGALNVLKWAHSVNPDVKPTRECLPSILVDGHVNVLEFLYSHDKDFLPGPYQANTANKDTMWHFNIIVKLFSIDPSRVPLERIYHHALELQNLDTMVWARNQLQESNCEEYKPTLDDVRHAITARDWSFIRWIVEKDSTLFVDRDLISAVHGDDSRPHDQQDARRELLELLKVLYKASGNDKRYLPTVGELQNSLLEDVKWTFLQDENHLSREDLVLLCESKGVGADLHWWVSKALDENLVTLKMANAAAENGNVEALSWIIRQNRSVAPSKDSIARGLVSMPETRAVELWGLMFMNIHEQLPSIEYVVNSSLSTVLSKADLEMKMTKIEMAAMKKQMAAMPAYILATEEQMAATNLRETMMKLNVKAGESVSTTTVTVTEKKMIEVMHQKIRSGKLWLLPRLVMYATITTLLTAVDSASMARGWMCLGVAELFLTNRTANNQRRTLRMLEKTLEMAGEANGGLKKVFKERELTQGFELWCESQEMTSKTTFKSWIEFRNMIVVRTNEIDTRAKMIGVGVGTKEFKLEMEEFAETMGEAIEIMDKYYKSVQFGQQGE